VVALADKVNKGVPLGEVLPPVAADEDSDTGFGLEEPNLEENSEDIPLPELPDPTNSLELELPPVEMASLADEDEDFSLDFTPQLGQQASSMDGAAVIDSEPEQTVAIGDVEFSSTLYRTFLDEARALLARLRNGLAQNFPGALGEDFKRATHTLNGIAGTVRIASIQHLGGALEAALNRIPEQQIDDEARAAIAAVLTRLETMVAEIEQRKLPVEAADVIAQLNELCSQMPFPMHSDDAPMELDFSGLMSVLPDEASLYSTPASANVFNFPGASVEPSEAAAVMPEETPAEENKSTERRYRRIDDDLDEQLLPIFMEEAQELMPAIGSGLRD
jgi:chemosensory pili system protein ChpA (sensor histidine kinase/response regulator)